jgi:hypothetical protein
MMQNTPHIDLPAMIEAHIARTGMKPSRFGELAVGDPNLIRDLRSGRELRRKTASRIVEYMLTGKTNDEAREAAQ